MKYLCTNAKNRVQSINQILLFFFLFVLVACPMLGQDGLIKKLMQPDDFEMWHTMRAPQISGNGEWISYQLHYQAAHDSLFVLDTKGKLNYKFPNAHSGQFDIGENTSLFAFLDNEKGVGILHLKTGKVEWVEAERFEFSKNGKYLASYSSKSGNGQLQLLDIGKNKKSTIYGIQNYLFDPFGKKAVLIINDRRTTSIELLDLDTMRQSIVMRNTNSDFLYPIWNLIGNGFAFIESTVDSSSRLYYFEVGENAALKAIDSIDLEKFDNQEIANRELSLSDDGERLFFYTRFKTKNREVDNDTIKVQVWTGTDKYIYPRQQLEGATYERELMAVWWPKTGKIFQIGSLDRWEVELTKDKKYAISYNPLQYEPQFRGAPQSDFYITDLESGSETMFGERLETALGYLDVSPSGNFIAYYKEETVARQKPQISP